MNQKVTAEDAVKIIKSGNRVFIHTAAAAPQALIQAMTDRHEVLRNVEIVSAHTEGPVPYAKDEFKNSFSINCFFVGHNIRSHVQRGRAHYIPIFLSEIPALFRGGKMPCSLCLLSMEASLQALILVVVVILTI